MPEEPTRIFRGLERPETFTNTMPFVFFIRRTIPLLVLLLLLTWLVIGLLLGQTGLPGVFLVSLVLTLLFIAVMVYAKKRQFDATWGRSALELSPHGVVETVGKTRTMLEWGAVGELRREGLLTPLQAVTAGYGFVGGNLVTEGAVALGAAWARKADQDALVGVGAISISPDAAAILRAQFDQNMKQRQYDPTTGRPIVAVLLSHYDTEWRTGRIGTWIRSYRPDLLP